MLIRPQFQYANDGRCFIFELIYGVYPASDFTNFNQIEESGWEEEDDDDESSSALDQLQGMLHTTHWEQVDFWPYHWVVSTCCGDGCPVSAREMIHPKMLG